MSTDNEGGSMNAFTIARHLRRAAQEARNGTGNLKNFYFIGYNDAVRAVADAFTEENPYFDRSGFAELCSPEEGETNP